MTLTTLVLKEMVCFGMKTHQSLNFILAKKKKQKYI